MSEIQRWVEVTIPPRLAPFVGHAAIMGLMSNAMQTQTDKRRHVVSNVFFEDEGENEDDNHSEVKSALDREMEFKTQVVVVNETVLGPLSLDDVPPGLYVLMLKVNTPGQPENFYLWVTSITIP